MTQTMPLSIVDESRKPAAWLVAGGIVGAIVVTLSCLMILAHAA